MSARPGNGQDGPRGLPAAELGALASVPDAMRWTRLIGMALADRDIAPAEANSLLRVVAQWHKNEDLRLRSEDLKDLARQVAELRKQRGVPA